jgi:uncharacterized membrane protein
MQQKTHVKAQTRLIASALIGIIAGCITGTTGDITLSLLVGWNVAAVVFMVWIWLVIRGMDAEKTAEYAVQEDPTRALTDIILLLASIASLIAVGFLLVQASGANGFAQGLLAAVGIISVIIAWLLIHTIYTLRYAMLYYSKPEGGVTFGDKPSYSDFAYLAFTLGMTYQVSDTNLTNKKFRKAALQHALLSFIFGTLIVATTINFVAGLGR